MTSFVKIIPKHFTLSVAIVNRIVNFIFGFLLLTYTNRVDFYLLILYHVVLLNLFIGSIVFLWVSGDFLHKESCHLWTKVAGCLWIWMLSAICFALLPWWESVNKSGKRRHAWFFLISGGKPCLSFTNMHNGSWSCGYLHCPQLVWEVSFFFSFAKKFYHQWILNFFKCFFCNIIMWFPPRLSINILHALINTWILNQPCFLGLDLIGLWWGIIFPFWWTLFAYILLRIFVSI